MADERVRLVAEPGWVETAQNQAPLDRPFVSGDGDSQRFQVRYWRDADGNLCAKVYFGPHCEGPPGHAHGGSLASVLDETMGGNCWMHGYSALAGTLTIRYRAPFPLGQIATVRSAITKVEGRKIFASGTIHGEDGRLHTEGEGIFIVMREELAEQIAEEARKAGRTFGHA